MAVAILENKCAKQETKNTPPATPWKLRFFLFGKIQYKILFMVQKSGQKVEVGSLSPYLQGFRHPRWCRISSTVWTQQPLTSRGP